jgi:hypothetical protein
MKAQKDFYEKKYNLSSDNHPEFKLKKMAEKNPPILHNCAMANLM